MRDVVREPTGSAQLEMSDAKLVTHNSEEVAAHLPAPRCAWSWSEVGLSRGLIETLSARGLIERATGWEFRWRTTRRLWDAVERYTEDANPGAVAGQVRFRDAHDPRTRIEADARDGDDVDAQATLAGGAVPVREVRDARDDDRDELAQNLEAGERRERDIPDDQTTIADAVEAVGATIETTYYAGIHPAEQHPAQHTLREVGP